MMAWKLNPAAWLLGAALSAVITAPASAANLSLAPGAIVGFVTNSMGVPQMGATVMLFSREERLSQRALTDDKGGFAFQGLLPDRYGVKVSLASFLPVVKNNISVQPGMRSLLNVSLTSLFSSIQVIYPNPDGTALMTDDWRWALRTASATRPVLRLMDSSAPQTTRTAAFGDTRGVLRLSAGDGERDSAASNEADLGTAFALATSVYGPNQLQVSGNFGYGSQTGVPVAAFRTAFSRPTGLGNPEVSVTMRQLFLPMRTSSALTGAQVSGMPSLRSISVNLEDRMRLTDELSIQYGMSLESVSFVDRVNFWSPFARLAYSLGEGGEIEATYTSGVARPDLGMEPGTADDGMVRDLSTLGMFPRVSLLSGRPKVQRGENFELGYSKKIGSRTYRLGAYREFVRNAALTVGSPDGAFPSGDVVPDLFTSNMVFNAGNYSSMGYTLTATQDLGEHFNASLTYGSLGALVASGREVVSNSPDELRSMIHMSRRHAAMARVAGTVPRTGTHLIGSYQWIDRNVAARGHMYASQGYRPEVGLNLYMRQPIPVSILRWRMEATVDLRNLLAQGYLPLNFADGRSLLLMPTPRHIRGGLSFIF